MTFPDVATLSNLIRAESHLISITLSAEKESQFTVLCISFSQLLEGFWHQYLMKLVAVILQVPGYYYNSICKAALWNTLETQSIWQLDYLLWVA